MVKIKVRNATTLNSVPLARSIGIPFEIRRDFSKGLVEQAVDGMKSAILGGHYKVGEQVPSLNNFARLTGVSLKVPYKAYARLVDEGWLVPHRGVGFVASSPNMPVWKGKVLIIDTNSGYYGTELAHRLQYRLGEAGYLVEHAVVLRDRKGEWMFGNLDVALATSHDFAVCREHDHAFAQRIAAARTPYITFFTADEVDWMPRDQFFRGCVKSDLSAVADMVDAFKKRGLRTVVWSDINDVHHGYAAALAQAGFHVKRWKVPRTFKKETGEAVRNASFQFFMRQFQEEKLPDVFLITDDHVADGALYAMARTGIRVPDDVMVVAQYCPGFGLGFPSGLARLEWNPDEHVKGIAAFVVDQMVGGKNFPLPGVAPRFKMDKD